MTCSSTKGKVRNLSLLELDVKVEQLEGCCEDLKDTINTLEKNQVVDIVINVETREWELVLGDGSTKPFKKVMEDTQNNILEEED